MQKKLVNERLINACKRALRLHGISTTRLYKTSLKTDLDMIIEEERTTDQELPDHNNIRGEKLL